MDEGYARGHFEGEVITKLDALAKQHEVLGDKIDDKFDNLKEELDDHEKRIRTNEKGVTQAKTIGGMLGLIGGSVVAFFARKL